MIDHILGRPSITFRKYQVGLAVLLWGTYLAKGNQNGPPGINRLSEKLRRHVTPWQTMVLTMLVLYVSRNFGKLIGLESPEPLSNLYSRSFFRATWVLTALDAGFFSAMRIQRKWLRDLCSILFSGYYLIMAEQAEEKVRKVRSCLTVQHLRVAWNKQTTPYLSGLTSLLRPRFMKYPPRALRIPRPTSSVYKEPVSAWLYFDGPKSALRKQTKIILNIPGGGFVAMSPRTHDDSLFAWAGKTKLPVLSLDYKKAPEYPYPYALNECFDVYQMLVASRGSVMGLAGGTMPQIILSGDSAGGNLATGTTFLILSDSKKLPRPAGLVLIYPALNLEIGSWLTDSDLNLIRDKSSRHTNRRVVRQKSQVFRKLAPETPAASDSDSDAPKPIKRKTPVNEQPFQLVSLQQPVRTRLATPSLITYVDDRILSPSMLRAMILLYVGPYNRPDFTTDYLLSSVRGPDELLGRFPKTYFITGERDPLSDDTVIFAGRLRVAKHNAWKELKDSGFLSQKERKRGFESRDHIHVKLIPGVSHGFVQFPSVFPEAYTYIHEIGQWYLDIFADADRSAQAQHEQRRAQPVVHRRTDTTASSDNDDMLEMSLKLTRTSPSPDERAGPSLRAETPEDAHSPERPRSLVSQASEDDLIGRRMKGLTAGLTRIT